MDGDGREDLIIGGGGDGQIGIYLNHGTQGFKRVEAAAFSEVLKRDQTGLIACHQAPDKTSIFIGCANYEDGEATGPGVRQYDFRQQTIDDGLTTLQSSTGPLALADVTGDGGLELFVGGRVTPGAYPVPALSRLLKRQNQKWVSDVENTKVLDDIGMVSGAVFSDLDDDGLPELILACEWGPVRIFRNEHGKFAAWDVPLTWPGTNNSQPRPARLNLFHCGRLAFMLRKHM